MTWQVLSEYLETPEGKAEAARDEFRFRRGYWFGADAALDALRAGATDTELTAWVNALQAWAYGDCTRIVEPPPPPGLARAREF